ncbi:hypothetical protein QJS66_01370 [Kocuria rhizophila]|nr:hypothetical protein QJS66_01370 [Kocuria rhizophila]
MTETLTELPVEARDGAWHVTDSGRACSSPQHRAALPRRRGAHHHRAFLRNRLRAAGTDAEESLLDEALAPGSTATVTWLPPTPCRLPGCSLRAVKPLAHAPRARRGGRAVRWAVPCNDVRGGRTRARRHTVAGVPRGRGTAPALHGSRCGRTSARRTRGLAAPTACASPHRADRATARWTPPWPRTGSCRHEELAVRAAGHRRTALAAAAAESSSSRCGPRRGRPPRHSPSSRRPLTCPVLARPGAPGRRLFHTASWGCAPGCSRGTGTCPPAPRRPRGSGVARRVRAGSSWRAPTCPRSRRPRTCRPAGSVPARHRGRVGLAVENIVRRAPAWRGRHRVRAGRRGNGWPRSTSARRTRRSPPGNLHAFTPWRADPAMTPAQPVPVGGTPTARSRPAPCPDRPPARLRVPAARAPRDLADPAASWWITP